MEKYSMNEQQEIRVTLAEVEAKIEQGEALKRLLDNADFKSLFLEGYLGAESCRRLVLLLGDPSTSDPEMQNSIISDIRGVSQLNQYLQHIRMTAATAQNTLDRYNASLEEDTDSATE